MSSKASRIASIEATVQGLLQELKTLKQDSREDEEGNEETRDDVAVDIDNGGGHSDIDIPAEDNPPSDGGERDVLDPLLVDGDREELPREAVAPEEIHPGRKTQSMRSKTEGKKAEQPWDRLVCGICRFRGADRREVREHAWTAHQILLESG